MKSGESTYRKMNEDLLRITEWFTASKLTVNIVKLESKTSECGLPEKITILNEQLGDKCSHKTSWAFIYTDIDIYIHLDERFRKPIIYVLEKLN